MDLEAKITKTNFPELEDQSDNHQQQPTQCLHPKSSSTLPKSANQTPETLDLQPNLLDPESYEQEGGGTSLSRCFIDGKRETGVAEDDAVVKGKGEAATLPDPVAVDLPDPRPANFEICIKVDAFAKVEGESATNLHRKAATIGSRESRASDRQLHHSRNGLTITLSRVSPLMAKPPTLISTIFPWDKKGEAPGTKIQGRALREGEDGPTKAELLTK